MASGTEKDIVKFFRGREIPLKLFKLIRKLIEKDRSPEIEVSKTQISFGEQYKYIWVWLPQTWIKSRSENSLSLTILTGKKIKSDKIVESVQPKKGFWTHHIIIEKEKDIDDEVELLIKESLNFYEERLANKLQRSTKKKNTGS